MTLITADGTPLPKEPGAEVLEPVTETDPQLRVLVPVYKETPYEHVRYPVQKRQLWWRPGQVIRKSEWDAEFTPPTIAGVSPSSGPVEGGTTVTITGANFTLDAQVEFGANAAQDVIVVTPTKLTCTTPAGSAGAVDVTVTTAAGTATAQGGFTYVGEPEVPETPEGE